MLGQGSIPKLATHRFVLGKENAKHITAPVEVAWYAKDLRTEPNCGALRWLVGQTHNAGSYKRIDEYLAWMDEYSTFLSESTIQALSFNIVIFQSMSTTTSVSGSQVSWQFGDVDDFVGNDVEALVIAFIMTELSE